MGFDTRIGDMGSALSIGQQQRLLLARALYREPSILFLDEGTSHLDLPTELAIMQSIAELGITCIYTTHRERGRSTRRQGGVVGIADGVAWQVRSDG